ncbi:MAG: trigger factor [Bacteroidales bacterium]|nr:trigger factor [Bacteroidales bacterium]
MKITQKNLDDLTLIVTLNVEKEDYAEKRTKILKDFRRNADIKGFRKGMAPISLIEKMHGKNAQLDAVNNVISESLNNYITENKINVLGEPLPNETEQKPIDWENDQEFSVSFDIGTAPAVELELTANDKITYYNVKIRKEDKEKYISNLLKQFGTLVDTDVVKDDDFIIADLIQGETKIEGTYIALRSIATDQIKNDFIGKKSGDSFEIDVNKAFENETDRAAMLKVKKEELASLNPVYTVVIKEVKTFADAAIDQTLFDKMFGEGVVKSEEEFNEKVEERLKAEYAQESDYRFMLDAREALIEKAALPLPEEFLKRWLFTANEGKFTMEEIEKDFPVFLKDFRWQMIRQYITREQEIKMTREDLLDQARKIAAYQFAMYGLNNAPEEQLNQYAESILSNEKEAKRIYEKVEEDLVLNYVRSVVTLDKKSISIDKLKELTN